MAPSQITTIFTSCKNSYFIHIFTLFYIQKNRLQKFRHTLPLLSFCQNHPLKLPFSAAKPTKLSKTQISASKSPHNKLYTKQISTKSAHSRTPHPKEERQKLLLFRPSKADIPMILALHPGQFRKPLW